MLSDPEILVVVLTIGIPSFMMGALAASLYMNVQEELKKKAIIKDFLAIKTRSVACGPDDEHDVTVL